MEGMVIVSRTTALSVEAFAVVAPKRWNGRAVLVVVRDRRAMAVLSERCIVDCASGL